MKKCNIIEQNFVCIFLCVLSKNSNTEQSWVVIVIKTDKKSSSHLSHNQSPQNYPRVGYSNRNKGVIIYYERLLLIQHLFENSQNCSWL